MTAEEALAGVPATELELPVVATLGAPPLARGAVGSARFRLLGGFRFGTGGGGPNPRVPQPLLGVDTNGGRGALAGVRRADF